MLTPTRNSVISHPINAILPVTCVSCMLYHTRYAGGQRHKVSFIVV